MKLTDQELELMKTVTRELARLDYETLNKVFGSMTCKEIQALGNKLDWESYCDRHGMEYDDLDEYDAENRADEDAVRWELELIESELYGHDFDDSGLWF